MKKGIIFSAFDLLHPGHLLALKEAKEHCDYLVVGFHIDPQVERPFKNKPIETEFERWLRLDSCKYIDKIIPYNHEWEVLDILRMEQPHVRFLGEEYANINFSGKELPIEIHYCSRKHNYSTTNLRERIKNV